MAEELATFLFGSNNPGKLDEVRGYADVLSVRIIGMGDVRAEVPPPRVAEVCDSYEGNARLKARAYAAWSCMPTIADDTGIEIDVLSGLPGVYTAHYGLERVQRGIYPLAIVPARFVCCMAFADQSGRCISVTKELPGAFHRRRESDGGRPGLPYSAYFIPRGETLPLDQLVVKGFKSHRGLALQALLSVLRG